MVGVPFGDRLSLVGAKKEDNYCCYQYSNALNQISFINVKIHSAWTIADFMPILSFPLFYFYFLFDSALTF